MNSSTEEDAQTFDAREEPDGEETEISDTNIARTSIVSSAVPSHSSQTLELSSISRGTTNGLIKVPEWVMAEAPLNVLFNERANQQISDLEVNRVSAN